MNKRRKRGNGRRRRKGTRKRKITRKRKMMSDVKLKPQAPRCSGSRFQAPGYRHVSHPCVSSYRVASPGLAIPCAIHELGGCAAGSNLAFGWPRVAARAHCPTIDVNHRDVSICFRCIYMFIAPVGRVDMAENYTRWRISSTKAWLRHRGLITRCPTIDVKHRDVSI